MACNTVIDNPNRCLAVPKLHAHRAKYPSMNWYDHGQGRCWPARPGLYIQPWSWDAVTSQTVPPRQSGEEPFPKEDQSAVTRRRAMVQGRADPSNSPLQLDCRGPQQREGTSRFGTLRVFTKL